MNTKNIFLIIALVIIIGVSAWISYTTNMKVGETIIPEGGTNQSSGDLVQETASSTADIQGKMFVVVGKNYTFEPSLLNVKKGEKITIVLDNVQGFHDLKIDEFHVATEQIREGEKDTITFVPDKLGSFEYYCSVGKHREMGMKGTLVVQ